MKSFIKQLLGVASGCFIVAAMIPSAEADLSISQMNVATVIDFDSTLADSNNGQYAGNGIVNTPGIGQLDSNSWVVSGLQNGVEDTSKGSNHTLPSQGNGTSAGLDDDGGLWAAAIEIPGLGNPGNNAFGFQPTDADLTPGTIDLYFSNDTGNKVVEWDFSYNIYQFNKGNRSTRVGLQYSTDNGNSFVDVNGMDFVSDEAGGTPVDWEQANRSTTLNAEVDNGNTLIIRWTTDAELNDGNKFDQLAIDDISLAATAIPEPASAGWLLLGLAAACGVRRRR